MSERDANRHIARTVQLSSQGIGRFAHVPGKGQRVNFWRRIARRIVGALT